MATALNVAKYILLIADDDDGDLISNLKLQKLLYYCQGFSLAILGRELFSAKMKAWQHGPVVPEVWQAYRDAGSGQIPPPSDFDANSISVEERNLINEVYAVYGQFSASKLRNMTHAEPPWADTDLNGIITNAKLVEYFSTQVKDDDERDSEAQER